MSFDQAVRRVVAEMLSQQAVSRHGTVKSVDPARGLVRVAWDEDGTLSGWLPVAQSGAGSGWSMVSVPKPGAQAFVTPDTNDMGHGVVVGFTHYDQAPPPNVPAYKDTGQGSPAQPGELLLVHDSGASIRLKAGGVIEMRGTTVKIDGDLLVSGQIRDLDGIHGTLDELRQAYNQHRNTGVVPGSGLTGLTDHPTP